MMDFALTANDLEISNGNVALCQNDTAALAQCITIRLKTLKGEWFMDINLGVPYLSQVFGKKRSHRFLRKVISDEIKTIPGVLEITHFSLEEVAENHGIIVHVQVPQSNNTTLTFKETIGV